MLVMICHFDIDSDPIRRQKSDIMISDLLAAMNAIRRRQFKVHDTMVNVVFSSLRSR